MAAPLKSKSYELAIPATLPRNFTMSLNEKSLSPQRSPQPQA
ncbi:hypothetical protein Q4E40_06620 [Pontibacter sp. BT731]|nr:hypothetical protein [Pontibacter sp. BT731]MDO6389793.1 hypothetical protein [Pontibacter sp. BT731]